MTSLSELRQIFSGLGFVCCAVRPPGFHHIGAIAPRGLAEITCSSTWIEPQERIYSSQRQAQAAADAIRQGMHPDYPPNPMGDWFSRPIAPRFTASILQPMKSKELRGYGIYPVTKSYDLSRLVDVAKMVRKAGGLFFCAVVGDDQKSKVTAFDRACCVLTQLGVEKSFSSEGDAVMALRGSMSLLLLSDPSITHWDGRLDGITPPVYPPLLHLGLQPGEDPL